MSIKKRKIYLFYHPGTYGSFVRWVIEYLNDDGHRVYDIPSDPIMPDGSAHNRGNLPQYHPRNVFDALEDVINEPPFYRVYRLLPKTDEQTDTATVINYFAANMNPDDRIIYIDATALWSQNVMCVNMQLKTDYYKSIAVPLLKNWNPKAKVIDDLEIWEQREFLSMFLPGMTKSLTELTHDLDKKVMRIYMAQVLTGTYVKSLMEHVDLPRRARMNARYTHVEKITRKFATQQTSITELGQMYNYAQAVRENRLMDTPEMSLFTQAIMQHSLREHGYVIDCYGMNSLPATSLELAAKLRFSSCDLA